MANTVYGEAVSGGVASVPFDPKKHYYIAFFKDMSHALVYGFVEQTSDPFSKPQSCDGQKGKIF